MNIPNNIDCHTFLQIQIHQALLCSEMAISTQYDFPYVSSWNGFSILKPLDHGLDKLQGDTEFAVIKTVEFGACVGFFDFAAA